jgi:hypothetical protein
MKLVGFILLHGSEQINRCVVYNYAENVMDNVFFRQELLILITGVYDLPYATEYNKTCFT